MLVDSFLSDSSNPELYRKRGKFDRLYTMEAALGGRLAHQGFSLKQI